MEPILFMRGVLNAKYVYEFDKIPPLGLKQTIEELKSLIPPNVYLKILEVIEIKSKGLERETILRIPEFDEFFNIERQKEYTQFNKRKPDINVFNKFLQEIVL